MSEANKKCCQDCKKGQQGQNKSCEAKLMLEKVKKQTNTLKNNTLNS